MGKSNTSLRLKVGTASARRWAGLALVALVTAIGAVWFWLVEGFAFVDALYQSVITVSTVGFAEIEPLDRSGRLFTIVLIAVGVAAMVYAVGGFAEMLIESSLRRYSERRREKKLDRMNNHTILCGFGRTGVAVAEMLPAGTHLGIIEQDGDRVDAAKTAGYLAIEGDCTRDEVLSAAGIDRAARVVVCLSRDSDAISTVLSARMLNPDTHIVTRVNEASEEHKLRLAGANHVVSPIQMGAQRLVADAMEPTVGSFLDAALQDSDEGLTIRAIPVQSAITASMVAELEHDSGVKIIGAQDQVGRIVSANQRVESGQILIALGHRSQLSRLETDLRATSPGD